MAFKAKELNKDEIEQIRASQDGQLKLAKCFGISQARVGEIKKSSSLDEALKLAKGKSLKESPSPERQVQGTGQESFVPIGKPTDTQIPELLTIGTFRMPFEDWGYSSSLGLLVVAQTYQDFKAKHQFEGKVGDFCAYLCQAFRYMAGWDIIGGGLKEQVKIAIEQGGNYEQSGGENVTGDDGGHSEASGQLKPQ